VAGTMQATRMKLSNLARCSTKGQNKASVRPLSQAGCCFANVLRTSGNLATRNVKPSLRQVLAESHVAAITIAVLLFWSLYWAFLALWPLIWRVAGFFLTAAAILDIPYFSTSVTTADRLMLFTTFSYLCGAIVSVLGAWILSRCVFGLGPLRTLAAYRNKRIGRKHVGAV
jgi:hypothetical protein